LVQVGAIKRFDGIGCLEQRCGFVPGLHGSGALRLRPHVRGLLVRRLGSGDLHLGYAVDAETISPARHVPDGTIHATLAQHATQHAHRPLQRIVGDGYIRPEGIEQLFLGDDPIPVARQVDQQIEHTRLQRDFPLRVDERTALFIELEGSKPEGHIVKSRRCGKGSDKDQAMISPR
jgi:hypothetical protein